MDPIQWARDKIMQVCSEFGSTFFDGPASGARISMLEHATTSTYIASIIPLIKTYPDDPPIDNSIISTFWRKLDNVLLTLSVPASINDPESYYSTIELMEIINDDEYDLNNIIYGEDDDDDDDDDDIVPTGTTRSGGIDQVNFDGEIIFENIEMLDEGTRLLDLDLLTSSDVDETWAYLDVASENPSIKNAINSIKDQLLSNTARHLATIPCSRCSTPVPNFIDRSPTMPVCTTCMESELRSRGYPLPARSDLTRARLSIIFNIVSQVPRFFDERNFASLTTEKKAKFTTILAELAGFEPTRSSSTEIITRILGNSKMKMKEVACSACKTRKIKYIVEAEIDKNNKDFYCDPCIFRILTDAGIDNAIITRLTDRERELMFQGIVLSRQGMPTIHVNDIATMLVPVGKKFRNVAMKLLQANKHHNNLGKEKVEKQDLVDAIIVEFIHWIALETGVSEFSIHANDLKESNMDDETR